MVCAKVRIRFRKAGDLRLVSHHDLMRTFERMLRRANLPFCSSSGFNPRPRLVFAQSLALGIVGCREVAELELDADLSAEEVRDRLIRQAPPGLEILDVCRINLRTKAQVRQVTCRIPVPPERAAGLPERITALLASPDCWVERTRPQPRRLNLRPYLNDLRLSAEALEMDLLVTPNGAARPEEVLNLLGLADLLDAGYVLERTAMELHDEHEGATESSPTSFSRDPEGNAESALPSGSRLNGDGDDSAPPLDT